MREGGQNGFVHQLPGRMTWPHLVFRRGVTDSNALFDWFSKTSGEGFASNENKLTEVDGSRDSHRQRRDPVAFVGVHRRLPGAMEGSRASRSRASQALEEELEIAHHGFRANTQAS